ncbi:DUF4128 domain-containing protein [Salmonella enterica]
MMPDIQTPLDAWLGVWADDMDLPVAWPNVTFTPPDGAYLRVAFLPAAPYSVDLAGECVVHPGIYQVTVVTPAGRGRSLATRLAGDVASLFHDGLEMEGDGFTVWVSKPPAVGQPHATPPTWEVPVSVSWRVDLA